LNAIYNKILKSGPSDATPVLLQRASSLKAVSVYVLTSKMALNQQHKADKMARNKKTNELKPQQENNCK